MVNLSVYFNFEAIVRHYYAYQSMSIAVGEKKLPCQRKGANSEDVFAVAVTTGELIIGREKFPVFLIVRQISQFTVNILDLRLKQTVLDSSA